MGTDFNEDEKKIYQEELDAFNSEIEILEREHKNNNDRERNELLEISVFLDMLRNLHSYFKNATYVQKREISKILFSNITINNKKRLTIEVKPNFESLFFLKSEGGGIRTRVQKALIIISTTIVCY